MLKDLKKLDVKDAVLKVGFDEEKWLDAVDKEAMTIIQERT